MLTLYFFQRADGHETSKADDKEITGPDFDAIKKRLNGDNAKLTDVDLPSEDEVPDLVRYNNLE